MTRALLLFGLSACALHGPTPRSQINPPLPQVKAPNSADSKSSWWVVLQDPELKRLVSETLANNPDLRAFSASLRQAQAMARVAGGARFPSLSFATSAAGQPFTPFVVPLPGFEQDPDTQVQATIQPQFNLAYEADLFGRVRSSSSAAHSDAQAAKHDLEALRLVSVAQVLELVLGVFEGREQLALLATNEKLLKQQLKNLQNRYRSGLATLLSVRQQEELIATAIAQRPLLLEQVQRAGRRLALLTGRHAGQAQFPKGAELPDLPAAWAGAVSAAFVHRRPDVSSAFARVHAADHRVAAAIAGRLPSLRFSGAAGFLFMGRSTPDLSVGEAVKSSYDAVADDPADNLAWTLSAQLLQPIYQGGAVRARLEAANAGREAAIERYRKTLLTAFEEVVSSHASEAAQRAYLTRLTEQRAALQSSLDVASKRYTAGLTEYRVLLQTQLALLRADQALIRAKRQVWSGRIRLLRAAAGPLNETTQ